MKIDQQTCSVRFANPIDGRSQCEVPGIVKCAGLFMFDPDFGWAIEIDVFPMDAGDHAGGGTGKFFIQQFNHQQCQFLGTGIAPRKET